MNDLFRGSYVRDTKILEGDFQAGLSRFQHIFADGFWGGVQSAI